METEDGGEPGLWVLRTLDRRSCTQDELNVQRPGRCGDPTLYQILCQLLRRGLICREAGLPRYRTSYALTGAGRQHLRTLEENHLSHHLQLQTDRAFSDLFSLALREFWAMTFHSGAVLVPSKSPDPVVIGHACELLATLVPDEEGRYLVSPDMIQISTVCRSLISPLPLIDLPPTALDLVVIPVPAPPIMAAQVQEINRLLSVRGVLLVALPFSSGTGNISLFDDLVRAMIPQPLRLTIDEEMALIRTLDLYFDVYCLRHNRSALLICRRWGTGPEGQEEEGDTCDPVYPCRVVEVND